MTEEIENIEPKEPELRLDFNNFKDKFGNWAPKFKPFIEGEEMFKIFETIRKDAFEEKIDVEGNKTFVKKEVIVPESKNTFRAFSTTNPIELKVIFYLMDPYPKRYGNKVPQATGIAMDCSNSPNGKMQPSLEIFYKSIEADMGKKIEKPLSLEYLHEQGVMMLNTDLTCKLNKTESHKGLWEPFQKYLLEEVLGSDTHIIYVLCGKSSKKMEKYINPFCKTFKIEHPVSASYSNTDWEHDDIFRKINRILKDNNQREIFWDKTDWDNYKDPPF